MHPTWQQQVNMLLKATNKQEKEAIIQFLKEKAASSAGADKSGKGKANSNHYQYSMEERICKYERF